MIFTILRNKNITIFNSSISHVLILILKLNSLSYIYSFNDARVSDSTNCRLFYFTNQLFSKKDFNCIIELCLSKLK